MKKTCKQCKAGFEFTEVERNALDLVAFKVGENKYDIPDFDICYDCRQQKRLACRNEKTLYKRDCDKCHKNMVTVYDKGSAFPVYCQECFWGDGWNAMDYGMDFDFSRPFFEQFKELMNKVPRLAVINKQSENSEYCNYSFANKNCYLMFGSHYEEDCMYGRYSTKNRNCVDFLAMYNSELCYECIFSKTCYKSVFLDHCENCQDCYFSFDLKGCKNCIFSHGLRNKEYFIFNKEHSKQEYEDYVKKLKTGSYNQWKNLKDGWTKYKKENAIFKQHYQTNCENCDGTDNENSKNLINSSVCTNCEDCVNGFQMDETYSSVDNSHMGYDKCEICCNCIGCSATFHCLFCDSCWDDSELVYCNMCFSSRNSFGSIGLRHNDYCIFNKQCKKEEYEELLNKIIVHMQSDGEWGQFFNYDIFPYGYNETVAMEYFPLSREKILERSWSWKEVKEELVYEGYKLPDDLDEIDKSICDKVLKCSVTGRPYKILKDEFDFYKKMNVPIPRHCPDQRHVDRHVLRSGIKTYNNKCDKCGDEMKTVFAPDKKEKVYCEKCYLKEVY